MAIASTVTYRDAGIIPSNNLRQSWDNIPAEAIAPAGSNDLHTTTAQVIPEHCLHSFQGTK